MYACMHACTYACTYVCMYIYKNTNRELGGDAALPVMVGHMAHLLILHWLVHRSLHRARDLKRVVLIYAETAVLLAQPASRLMCVCVCVCLCVCVCV